MRTITSLILLAALAISVLPQTPTRRPPSLEKGTARPDYQAAVIQRNMPPKMPTANMVAEWRMTESGQQAFNYAPGALGTAARTTNLLGLPENAFHGFSGNGNTSWASVGTATDGFAANPIDGNLTATHYVSTSGVSFINQNPVSFPAGQYTASLYVLSNNGATQHCRFLAFPGFSDYSPDLPVTTTWTQITWTFTVGAAITQFAVASNDAAGDPMDIVIYGAQLQAGATASAYVPADGYIQMGKSLGVESSDPVRDPNLGLGMAGKRAGAAFSTPTNFSGITVYAVGCRPNTTRPSAEPLVSSGFDANKFSISAKFGSANLYFAFGTKAFGSQTGELVVDTTCHIYTGMYDGTWARSYLDNMEVMESNQFAAVTQNGVNQYAVGMTPDLVNTWPGNLAYMAIYNVGKTLDQLQADWKTIQSIMAFRGIFMNDAATSRYYLAEGDSITDYSNLQAGSYYYKTVAHLAPLKVEGQDIARSGSRIQQVTGSTGGDMVDRVPIVHSLYNPNRKMNIMSILIGANDLGGPVTPTIFLNNLRAYCNARRAEGWTIVLLTVLPQKNPGSSNPNFIADRNSANAMIKADHSFYDALADVASDPNVGCDTCGNNTTYYPDGVHPSSAATDFMWPYVVAAINSLTPITPGTIPTANLAAEYRFDEGAGQSLYNRVTQTGFPPITNLFQTGEQFGNAKFTDNWSGCTVTDFAGTDPNGNNGASRVQCSSGQALQYGLSTVPAGTYTLSLYAKSNTGASQTFRLGDPSFTVSSDLTATTAWQRFTYTFTRSSTGSLAPAVPWTGSGGAAIDLLTYGATLNSGAADLGYTVPTFGQILGTAVGSDASDPTWNGTGLTFGASKNTIGLSTNGISSAAGITVYAVIKKTGADLASGMEPLIGEKYTGGLQFELASADGASSSQSANVPTFMLGGSYIYGWGVSLTDNNWHVLCGTYDGTTQRLYLDAVEVASKVTSISTQTLHRLYLGRFPGASNESTWYFPGQISMGSIYTAAHTAAQVQQNTAIYGSLMGARGLKTNVISKVVFVVGDSFTDPTSVGVYSGTFHDNWFYKMQQGLSPFIQGRNLAISGQSVHPQLENGAAQVDALIDKSRLKNILCVLIGANDMNSGITAAQYVANLKAYCQARQAAGWTVVVNTVCPQTIPGVNALRNQANTLIRADTSFYSALADLAADPNIGPDSAASNTTWYVDGEHPTAAGQTVISNIYLAAVTPLL